MKKNLYLLKSSLRGIRDVARHPECLTMQLKIGFAGDVDILGDLNEEDLQKILNL